MVLVHRVDTALVGTLEVQLLGVQEGLASWQMSTIGSMNRGSYGELVHLGRDMGEWLETVHDVGVALPFQPHLGLAVALEHVAAGGGPPAVALGDETLDQFLARRRRSRRLGRAEGTQPNDETLAPHIARSRRRVNRFDAFGLAMIDPFHVSYEIGFMIVRYTAVGKGVRACSVIDILRVFKYYWYLNVETTPEERS